jgi:hypothetical protein
MVSDEANASGGASDPDDWFSEPDVGVREQDAGALPSSRADRRSRYRGGGGTWSSGVPPARLVAFAAGAVALVLLVLAVSGVFSSSSSSSPSSSSRVGGKTPAASSSARNGVSGSPVSLPAGILTQGSSGEAVKQLQLALASAGHSSGPADGVFGLATVRALEAFQRSAGLTADGVYGARTKTALAHALSSG